MHSIYSVLNFFKTDFIYTIFQILVWKALNKEKSIEKLCNFLQNVAFNT
jgi:hypothetical protein